MVEKYEAYTTAYCLTCGQDQSLLQRAADVGVDACALADQKKCGVIKAEGLIDVNTLNVEQLVVRGLSQVDAELLAG